MNSGVYEILNQQSGKRYIGSALRISRRFVRHKKDLRSGQHHSRVLQRSWDKYGAAAFTFQQLLRCAPENLLLYEQLCLDAFKPEYNCSPTAGNCIGVKHSEAFRQRCRELNIGRKHTAATKEKIAAASRARIFSPESSINRALAQRGNKNAKGFVHSPESRQRMSEGRRASWARKKAELCLTK